MEDEDIYMYAVRIGTSSEGLEGLEAAEQSMYRVLACVAQLLAVGWENMDLIWQTCLSR